MIGFGGVAAEEICLGSGEVTGMDFDSEIICTLAANKTNRRAEVIAYGHWLYERTLSLLLGHKKSLKAIVAALLRKEELTASEARKIFRSTRY